MVDAARRDRDVDKGLRQIEQLLSALVRLHPDDISDSDIYGCDYDQHDRLTSTAGRLLRHNRSLDLQLSQAVRQNIELKSHAEQLQTEVCRLRDHCATLRNELDCLRAACDDLWAELSDVPSDSSEPLESVQSIVEMFGEIKNKIRQLQAANHALGAKVTQMQEDAASDGQRTELYHASVEEREREMQLKQNEELQKAGLKPAQQLTETTLAVNEDLRSRIDELETQLCVQQNKYAAMRLSLQQEREFSRAVEHDRKRLMSTIEELRLEAQKTKDEFDATRMQLEDDSEAIRRENEELMKRISELGTAAAATTDASPTNDCYIEQENSRLRDEVEALRELVYRRRSELMLKTDDEMFPSHPQQQQRHRNHSADSLTVDVAQQIDGVATGRITDIHARLLGQTTVLTEAIKTQEQLCGDLTAARTHNDRLSDVVDDLRAQLDAKDSHIERLRVSIADLEHRLAAERREFLDAVELLRRENTADCDKIANENQHLATLLAELEQSCKNEVKSLNENFNVSISLNLFYLFVETVIL